MTERLRPLDGIRGLAIIAVMANHTSISGARGGYLGVDVFFVLSGYLITTLLLGERERVGRFSFARFYMRRVLRLYPALIIACVLAVALSTHVGYPDRHTAVLGALTAAGYLQDAALHWGWPVGHGLFHTWTLSIEEQFYLVWPVVLAAALLLARGRLRGVLALLAVCVVYSTVAMIVLDHENAAWVLFRPDTRGGGLLIGCLVAVALDLRPVRAPAGLGWLGLVVVVSAFLASPAVSHQSVAAVSIPAVWLGTVALVVAVVRGDGGVGRVLGWRPLAYVGLISYGLYLYHPLIYAWVSRDIPVERRLGAPLAIALSFAAAFVSYRLIELPFLRVKKRFEADGDLLVGGVAEVDRFADQPPLDQRHVR